MTGKLHIHPGRRSWLLRIRKIRDRMCHCGHRVKEHADPVACGRCDCPVLHVLGDPKPKTLGTRKWINGRFVRDPEKN